MIEAPRVQSIISSKSISEKEAKRILSKFLVEQKKYFEDVVTDVAPSTEGSEEDYFDMDDDDDGGTFEETESRLEGIVRSLSGIKKPVITNTPVPLQNNAPSTANADDNEDEEVADSIQIPEQEVELAEPTPVSIKEESNISNEASPAEITKSDKKVQKKAEKEAKKSAKKAGKEAKKAEKKAAKSAKKEAKKDKRKRKSGDEAQSESSAKRVKKE
jgi:histone H1/5